MKDRLFMLLQYLLPHHLLSRAVGLLAECRTGWLRKLLIRLFISHYKVDMSEAAETDYRRYACFNDFFTRALRDDARTIDAGNTVACPADGAVSAAGAIKGDLLFQAKGHSYTLGALLGGDSKMAGTFHNGTFATIYLSPKDYHRVHIPLAGKLKKLTYIPGALFSVNNTTEENIPGLFARNERLVSIWETEQGTMAVILVGAMIVAGIETSWSGQIVPAPKKPLDIYSPDETVELGKGDELGRFKLGSTVILLFEENRVQLDQQKSQAGCAVKMGERIAELAG